MSTLRSSIKNAVTRSGGSVFWKKYTITSSAITTSAQTLTPTITGGELVVMQVILQTDATGLAGGTNFELSVTNAVAQKGINTAFVAETVANLGANITRSMVPYQAGTNKYQFSVTGVPIVMNRGSYITYQNTAANGTGAGTMDIYLRFERLDDGSQLSSLSSGTP